MKLRRRDFLKLAGASALAAGLGACQSEASTGPAPVPSSDALWVEPEERFLLTACTQCPGGCGLRARVVGGRLVTVAGHPDHPVSRGGACPRAHGSVQVHYHPDRVRVPLERVGERGGGQWREISWERALSRLREALAGLRSAGHPERLVVVSDAQPGLLGRLLERFARAYGTPNLIFEHDAAALPVRLMQGLEVAPAWDLERSELVLSFGAVFLDDAACPLAAHRQCASLRRGRVHPGQLIQMEPRLSMTASRADRWLPVPYDAQGAVALAVAYVLIKEAMTDEDFLAAHAHGWEDFTDARGRERRGFKRMVLEECRLEEVAARAGVSATDLLDVARAFGTRRPAVALYDRCLLATPGGLEAAMAVHALNAMVGSVDVPGGVLFAPPVPYPRLPPLVAEAVAARGRARPRLDGAGHRFPLAASSLEGLAGAARGDPRAVGVLLLHRCNPVHSLPQGGAWAEALRSAGLVRRREVHLLPPPSAGGARSGPRRGARAAGRGLRAGLRRELSHPGHLFRRSRGPPERSGQAGSRQPGLPSAGGAGHPTPRGLPCRRRLVWTGRMRSCSAPSSTPARASTPRWPCCRCWWPGASTPTSPSSGPSGWG